MKNLITSLLLACASISTLSAKEPNLPKTETFANKPQALCFVENKGQIRNQHQQPRTDIDVKLDAGNGLSIFIGGGAIHYQWSRNRNEAKKADNLPPHQTMDRMWERMTKPSTIDIYRMDVTLVGANAHAEVIKEEQQEYYERYYNASLGEDGALANTFNKVTYKNVYPNIDWVLYSRNNELKYDFVVHPGGNAADIKLKYGGATALRLENGALTATTPYGNVAEEKPYSYEANTKQTIASSFVLNGDMLSFNIAPHEGTIVIDPAINWGTYYGGTGNDYSYDVDADNMGNSFLVGAAASSGNIATTGAYQMSLGGSKDAYIVKFNAAGVRQWGTYYGGSLDDMFWSVACDPIGNLYASGGTLSSSGIASTGAHQTAISIASQDAMLIKFSPTGSRLWGTYYGGSGAEDNAYVACDGTGNVYLGGETYSTNNIATTGAHQTSIGAANYQDAFLVKFNSNGVRQWGTYYGGSQNDYSGRGMACDPSGNVFICGSTNSATNIASTGSHQSSYIGPPWDGYLAKFNSAGIRQWGTYYGDLGFDYANDVAVDSLGNAYIVGSATCTTGIATFGAYQPTLNGQSDGFIAKFNSAGVRQWGSYYGSTGNDWLEDIEIGAGGTIYTSGWTTSTTGIATSNGYQTAFGGVQDLFLVEWNNTAIPSWATYYGGSQEEQGFGFGPKFGFGNGNGGCAWSAAGYLFLCGTTYSTSGIATSNGHQTSHGSSTGAYDGFLASFAADTVVYIKQPFIDTVFCPGDTFKLAYGVNCSFKTSNTFSAQLSDATGSFATPINIGSKASAVADTIICIIPKTTPVGNGYRVRIVANSPSRVSANNGVDIRIKPGPPNLNASASTPLCEGSPLTLTVTTSATTPIVYSWTGPLNYSASNATNTIPNITLAHAGDYVVAANQGNCASFDTVTVVVNPIPATPIASIDSPVCYDATLGMIASSATPGVSYSWTGPNSFASSQINPTIPYAKPANSGTYSVTATKSGCTSPAALVTTLVYPKTPLPAVMDSAIQCVGSTLNIPPVNIPGATYTWTGPNGFTSTTQNLNIPQVQLFHTGYYFVTAELNGCLSDVDSVFAKINIKAKIGAYASPNDTVCAGTFMTYVAMQNNGGASPVYQWYRNYQPIAGANSLLYTSPNVTNGDKFHCTMYSVGVCDLPVIVSTDTIEMVVLPIVTKPSATITANPTLPQPNELVVFTAKAHNGGPNPKYQWQLNGKDQAGATYATWNATTLRPFDKVNVVITSDDPCTNIKTAVSDTIMIGFPTHIADINTEHSLQLYPNPNKGSFTLTGNFNQKTVAVEVINAVGQTVYKQQVTAQSNQLKIEMPDAAKGVYLIRFTNEDQTFGKRFTIQ